MFVNLAPGPVDAFTLILATVEMVKETNPQIMGDGIRGWMKTAILVRNFLKSYSEAGGTHHGAIVYGQAVNEDLTTLDWFFNFFFVYFIYKVMFFVYIFRFNTLNISKIHHFF